MSGSSTDRWVQRETLPLQHEWSRREHRVHKSRKAPCHELPATIFVGDYTTYYHNRRWRSHDTPLSEDGPLELLVTDEWLTYDVVVETTRAYDVTFCVAAADGFGGGDIGLVVDGDPSYHVPFEPTGGWDVWGEITTRLELRQGRHTIQLCVLEGGWKLSAITVR